MSVRLNIRDVRGLTVVDVSGRITLGQGATALRDSLRELPASGKKTILLNLTSVRNIDSSGIAELVSGFTAVANAGGSLKLLGLRNQLKEKVLTARAAQI